MFPDNRDYHIILISDGDFSEKFVFVGDIPVNKTYWSILTAIQII